MKDYAEKKRHQTCHDECDCSSTAHYKYIGTLVYNIARKPPTKVGKLDDNVFGFLTETNSEWCNPEVKQSDQAMTRQWRQRLTHMSRYEYFGLSTITPRVYPHAMTEQMKHDKSLGL